MKKISLSTFFALFLFSLAVSAQTYERAKLWDAEIKTLTEIDVKQTPPKDAVLFVGSSSIRFWRNLRGDFPQTDIINRGFGGSHLEDVNYYFDKIITPFRAKKIFLYAGENDVTAGKTPEMVLEDFRKFIALVRKKSPRSKIYFISLKPSPARWELRDKFQQTNALIKTEVGKMNNAVFVDVWTAMLDEKGSPKAEIFVADKLHLNEKGYAVWREVLAKYLK